MEHDSQLSHLQDASSPQRISIALLGERLNPALKEPLLIEEMGATRFRDAYRLHTISGEVWLFDYGVLVCWNLLEDQRAALCNQLQSIIEEPITRPSTDQFAYEMTATASLSIHNDKLVVPESSPLARLALSHAFAQSAKLEFFEAKSQEVIQQNAQLTKQLAKTGKVPLSRQELAKRRGVLFDTSSDITLHFSLLDTPEFFWDYPELELYYQSLAKYLDLQPRVEILNKKLSTIQSLLDMLAAEENHKHSAFLEWIIIVLIAVDIVVYFFEV